MIELPRLREAGVVHGFSTRDMGSMRRDGESLLTEPRRRFARHLQLDIESSAFMGAVHGAETGRVDGPGLIDGVDAIATDVPGLGLFALFADCYPILIFDPVHRALALAHAGWRGTRAGVAAAAVARLADDFGSRPGDLVAGIGPGACGHCYQVGPEVAAAFDAAFVAPDTEDRARLDLAAANHAALVAAGIPPGNVEVMGVCTIEDLRLHSHRRDADGGRFACLAAIA